MKPVEFIRDEFKVSTDFSWIQIQVVHNYLSNKSYWAQGRGLGKWLMSCIMAHPDLQGRMKWALGTRDAHGLYRKFKFTELTHPENWMELDKRK
jgi:hypothetical protein